MFEVEVSNVPLGRILYAIYFSGLGGNFDQFEGEGAF